MSISHNALIRALAAQLERLIGELRDNSGETVEFKILRGCALERVLQLASVRELTPREAASFAKQLEVEADSIELKFCEPEVATEEAEECDKEHADDLDLDGARAIVRALMPSPANGWRLVILESPFAGDVAGNTAYARQCLADCLKRREAPIASHLLYTQVLDDSKRADRILRSGAGMAWQAAVEALVVYTDKGLSAGVREAIQLAKDLGLPVEYRRLVEVA